MKQSLFTKHWLASISILLFFMAASTVASATIRYVNHDGLCGGHSPCYITIQLAVNASAPGDVILVAAGVYNENVTVMTTLTLKGFQVGHDARTRSGSESTINGGGANFTINADNVTIDGFTLNGPVNAGSASIVMQGGNTGETIQNNIFNNPGRAASFTTNNTVFTKNLVNNVFATASDGFQANTTPITNVSIYDNSFHGANGNIYNADITIIEGSSNVLISGNKSTGDGTLIALFKTNASLVIGNTVIGDGSSSAVYIGGGNSNVVVSGNTVSNAGSAVNVANNYGVGLNSSVTIIGNNLHNNITGIKVGASAVNSAGTVLAHNNKLVQNSSFGFNNLSSFTQNATCNWWGAHNGPGPVGPGSGDKVSPGVIFSPWLHSEHASCGDMGEGNGKTTISEEVTEYVPPTPVDLKLSNFPNPFSSATTIKYDLPTDSKVSLKIYNSTGQVLATLFEGDRKAGSYTAQFDATGHARGFYSCKLVANSGQKQSVQSIKLIVGK